MMLRHNTGKLRRPGGAQSIGADSRVVRVDRMAAREARLRPEQTIEQAGRQRGEPDREAAVDHRELGAALADVVEERRLLEQPAGLGFQLGQGVEHVEPVPLVVDRHLEEQGDEIRSENPFGVGGLGGAHLRRGVTPELADPMQR